MALWNHLVPDLVQLGVQERETDKLLPHSRYPSSSPENEYIDKKKSLRDHDQQPERTPTSTTTTFGRERIAEVGGDSNFRSSSSSWQWIPVVAAVLLLPASASLQATQLLPPAFLAIWQSFHLKIGRFSHVASWVAVAHFLACGFKGTSCKTTKKKWPWLY